jgi:hypothetical protein
MGDIQLLGADATVWSEPDMQELLALDTVSGDPFTCWITNHALDIYHKILGHRIRVSILIQHLSLYQNPTSFEYRTLTGKNSQGRWKQRNEAEKQTNLDSSSPFLYSDDVIQRLTRTLTIMIASMLPIMVTIILYIVKDTVKRLGIIAAFVALFSLALGLFTSATLYEVFSATAA